MTQGGDREKKTKNAKTRFNAETVLAKRKEKMLTKMLLRNVVWGWVALSENQKRSGPDPTTSPKENKPKN